MCGISGIYQFKNKSNFDFKKAIELMNESQFNRGPDGEGVFISKENGLAFGHRRLSIIDLSDAGKQPMNYGEIWITFNGEIYNFLELKKELEQKGYKFKTKTDTEIILALYAEYGEKSFSMLNGMFSFGLWDNANKKLFLVKDRYGIKPLYYYCDNEKIIFASTVKAIEKSGLISIEKNNQAYIGFLLFGSVPLPMTTIKNVLALQAGHYLEFDINGNQKLIEYYNFLEFFNKKKEIVFDEAVENIKILLNNSINRHLISDAPLGIFLSGGLDSSVISALVTLNRKNPITTLSIIFDEQKFSEQKYQKMVVEKIGSIHHEIKITQKNFLDSLEEIFKTIDQPTIDGVNTFFIAKVAKEAGLKVVLSGLGADEIFCGYSNFKKAVFLRKIQKLPKFLKLPLGLVFLFGKNYKKLNYLKNKDILSFYLSIRGLFMPKEVAKILDINLSDVEKFINELLINQFTNEQINKLHPVDLLSYLEMKFYLQNQLLKDTDFMSMRHSVEVRVPFLDHSLVEYLSGLSPELKIRSEINKLLLIEAMRDLLPQEIFNRPKMGFTFPFEKWLKEEKHFNGHWSHHWAKEVLNKF